MNISDELHSSRERTVRPLPREVVSAALAQCWALLATWTPDLALLGENLRTIDTLSPSVKTPH